jgi:hypothetical protein
MVDLNKVVVSLTGLRGLPGISTFYFQGILPTDIAALKTFWTSVASIMPAPMSVTIPHSGLTISEATGQPIGSWGVTGTDDIVPATGPGAYAAPCGAVVHWKTALYLHGRLLRGKTFLVPLTNGQYDSDGNIVTGALTILRNAATAFTTGGNTHTVYSTKWRSSSLVVSATVPDMAVILTSRRD